MTTRTYIFAGGGTGGHLFPGIAVAQELNRREPDARFLFVGSERDLERSIVARYQFEHRSLPVESLRTLTRRPFRFAAGNWRAWHNARQLIREERPCTVIGLGGYASAPIVWAAARVRVPVALLEQNVIPGRTTRWLSHSANVVCISFPESAARLSRSAAVHCTGNPLRAEIALLHSRTYGSITTLTPELLILGGSQGADSLNDAVLQAASLLRTELSGWNLVHQTGPRNVDGIRNAYKDLGVAATVEPFFDGMTERYRAASIVISRAGATTLAEVACCGLPMVLLPYPQAADDHQRTNAISFQSRGAAIVVEHRPTGLETGKQLATHLRALLMDPGQREALSAAAYTLARPDATVRVADHVQSLGSR